MPEVFDPYHRWLGIPPKDQPPNHYRLLGIERFESDQEVIRDAVEQRMAHVRTYQLGQYSELSQKILNELAAAKACLLDPQKKAAYDRQLRTVYGMSDARRSVAASRPPPRRTLPARRKTALRSPPRWLVPALAGGIALMVTVVGVVLVSTRQQDDKEAALASNDRKVIKPRGPEKPTPKPPDREPKTPEPPPAKSLVTVPPRSPSSEPAKSPAEPPSKPLPPTVPPKKAAAEPEAPRDTIRNPKQEELKPRGKTRNPTGTADDKKSASNRQRREWLESLPLTLPAPSDGKITREMFSAPKNWRQTLFPTNGSAEAIKDETGKPLMWVTRNMAVLNGPTALVHPSGSLFVLVTNYSKDKIDGCVKLWDEQGGPLFYSQYLRGRRHGILCYCRDGVLCLIQDCDMGKPLRQYLVKWTEADPQILLKDELTGDDAEKFRVATDELTQFERHMDQNQRTFVNKIHNSVVGQAHRGKLVRSLGTISGHSAAKAAEMRGCWSRSLGSIGL
jgi:hypothetical protein